MKIKFGDYFTSSMPRYKRLSELKRNEAVYIPSNYLLPNTIYSYINNPNCSQIPKEIIDDVLVVHMQKYDTMIDVNGNLFDWSEKGFIYDPKDVDDCQIDWFEKKISAVNNMLFEDKLDVESSIIYNLIEIRPLESQISLDYLRYYFWDMPKSDEEDNNSYLQITDSGIYEKPYRLNVLFNASEYACRIIEKETGCLRYIITPEILQNIEIEIDDLSEHVPIVQSHRTFLFEQSRAYGKRALQERFGSPLYESLESLEKEVYQVLTPAEKGDKDILSSYTGFVRSLGDALNLFTDLKENEQRTYQGISQASLMAIKTSCEIILKAKLRILNLSNWEPKNSFSKNISFIFENKRAVLSRWLSSNELDDFRNSLHEIRIWKNRGSHTSEFISIEEADYLIDIACNKVIRKIIEHIK